MKPQKRTATTVVEYWWCGVDRCTTMHPSEAKALRCPYRDRKPRPVLEERNLKLWRLVIDDGLPLSEAGKRYGLSGERTRQVIAKMARQRGIKYWPRPDGVTMAEYIREQITKD